MRSLLFIPADSERKLAKGHAAGADCLIIDLEDSVAAENKPRAREMAAEFLRESRKDSQCALYVRINPLNSGLAEDDLAAIVSAEPDGIMLPKANGIEQAEKLAGLLAQHEARSGTAISGAIRILPIITETAAGVLAAASWNRPIPRLSGLTWGAEDLSADLGIAASRDKEGRYKDIFRHARMVTVLAAAACRTEAIDTVYVDFRDEKGLYLECQEAASEGFTGKMAIHPAQIPLINEAFSLSAAEIAEAEQIVAAFQRAGNPGVVALEGKMYDRPHLSRAERLLARAARQKA